jgi:hypothetical protein
MSLSWRVTAAVTRVTLWPGNFEAIDTSDWPNKIPPGWDGPIDKTLWIVVFKDGQWRTTGSIEFWKGRTQTQSPLSSGLQDWWYYAPEIGQPQPGETVGVFYAAGDQRRKDVRTVEERTNIVTFVVPPNDTGTFSFAAVPPVSHAAAAADHATAARGAAADHPRRRRQRRHRIYPG